MNTLKLFTFAELTAQLQRSADDLREAATAIPPGYEINGRDAWDAEQVECIRGMIDSQNDDTEN